MKQLILMLVLTLVAMSFLQKSPPYIITGIVTDKNGEVLIGASVSEVKSKNRTSTDIDGKFSLEIKAPKSKLEIHYIGYNTKIIDIDSSTKILKIVLEEGLMMEDIVVTSLGIKRDEKSLGYAITTVGNESKNKTVELKGVVGHAPGISTNYYKTEENRDGESYSNIVENEFKKTSDNPLTTMSIDVDRASYSNVRSYLSNNQMPPIDAVRIEEMINYFDYEYDVPNSEDKTPFKISKSIIDCPWNKDHKILHVAMASKKIDKSALVASNLVFLIDVSGSMDQENKLPLLKSSLKMLVNELSEQDKISIVVYAGAAGVIIDGTHGSNKKEIIEALDRLEAGGSTAGAAGINKAYELAKKHFIKGGNNRVILASDGDFNVGVSSESELVKLIEKHRESNVYLSVLGFGMGNYQDSKMQQLADKGNGNHFYIDNILEAKKSLVKEYGSTLYTVANDVKIQVEFNPAVVAGYRVIGYENRQLANEDFNDDTKDAGELGSGHVVTALYEIIPQGVKSAFLKNIDPLKYSKKETINNKELATIKFRYKPLNSKQSIKSEEVINNKVIGYKNATDNEQWAISIAQFGLLLRESKFKGSSNYSDLLQQIKSIKSGKEDEFKKECIGLIETANKLTCIKAGE